MNTNTNSQQAAILSSASSEGVIKLRLDTGRLLTELELFLKGQKIVPNINAQGQQELLVQDSGERLVNDRGIQAILLTLSQTINSQGVQGNWKPEYFEQFVAEVDFNFSCDLWVNMRNWDVKLENYNVVCNAFMNLVQQFTSRIIDNKERESYGLSMKTSESVVQQQNSRAGLFGGS